MTAKKWTDLPVTTSERKLLREKLGNKTPDDVVILAKGAPDLLSRIIGVPAVERIQLQFPSPLPEGAGQPLVWATKHGTGAMLSRRTGSELAAGSGFEAQRDRLIEKYSNATSAAQKAAFGDKLRELYQRK